MLSCKKMCKVLLIAIIHLLASISVPADSLKSVISRTIQTNPEVLAAGNQRNASNFEVRQARAGFLPKVDMNVGAGHQDSTNVFTNFTNVGLYRRELGATARQMVFDGWATAAELASTKAKTNANAYETRNTSENIALQTVQAYLSVSRDFQLKQIAQENLAMHEKIFRQVVVRSKSGLGREADVEQARSRLESAKANLYSAQDNLRNSIALYYRITGFAPKKLLIPANVNPSALPKSRKQTIITAVQFNPALREATANVVQAREQHQSAKSANLPRVDILLEAKRNRDVDGVVGPDYDSRAMVEMQYNIFNGGADLARQKSTAYAFEQSNDIRNNVWREVTRNARVSWESYVTVKSRLPALRSYYLSQTKTVKAYYEQFKLDKRTLLDLLDAQNEMFSAKASYVSERFDYLYAQYQLLNSMGKLLSYLKINPPAEAYAPYREEEIPWIASNIPLK